MAWDSIPRTHSFSLGDFHDFDWCVFRFFVNHHLQKKYELSEGSLNQTIGSLLDLAVKKLHQKKADKQQVKSLSDLIEEAEMHIRDQVAASGIHSFFGAQIPYLTEAVPLAQQIFKEYDQVIEGKYQALVLTPTMTKLKPFWKHVIQTPSQDVQLWGGPDVIELGKDGVPEIVDYKYREREEDQVKMDMDLMPKIYTLLCAEELKTMGFSKARFRVKFWQNPKEDSFYEEFDLANMPNLEEFFKDKIDRILRTSELQFCEKDFCKVCKSPKRNEWISQIKVKGWLTEAAPLPSAQPDSDLPF